MGNYRQHLGFASVLGVSYAVAAYVYVGIHWVYGSVAALLATIGGLLPDLDSDSGVEMRGFTGLLGLLSALAVWQGMARLQPPPAFEFHLWAMVGTYVGVRHFVRRIVSRIAVHRGMSHSLPTCGVWGALVYLYYPSDNHLLRLAMALAVMLGFFSHLLLDEVCSVDLRGARVNKAFGTAVKLWAPSALSTFLVYCVLGYLTWRVVRVWPDGHARPFPPAAPRIPYEGRLRELKNLAEQVVEDAPALKADLDAIEREVAPELPRHPPTVEPTRAEPRFPGRRHR